MLSQAQVLNKILSDRDYSIVSLNNLNEGFFYNFKNEFNYIQNHYERYHALPDIETFVDTFPQFEVLDVKEPNSYLLEKLTKDYNQAVLQTRFNTMKKMLESGNIDEAVQYFASTADKIRPTAAVQSTNLWENQHRYELYKDKLSGKILPYIGTGFKELDDAIGGIDPLEENMVIIARTGIGKSWILLALAVAAAMQGKRVGIFSGEMSSDKVGYRVDTLMAHELTKRGYGTFELHNKALNRGTDFMNTARSYQKYFDFLKELKNYNIGDFHVLTPDQIAGNSDVNALRSFIEKDNLDILFIDQYSLLEDTGHSRSGHEAVANISKKVKQLQVMKHIPIISVAQMNRSGQDARDKDGKKMKMEVGTEQIGLTDRIGQDATIVLALDKEPTGDNGQYELKILPLKARDGGEGKAINYLADLDIGSFTYIPEEEKNSAKAEDMRNEYDDNGEFNF